MAASAAADPASSSPSPRSGRPVRHPPSNSARGEPEASAAAPPPPSSSPPVAAIASTEPSDRSPRNPPPEDVAPPSSDAARGKKQAWKRPPNGSVESGDTVIGGAASWPALSESAKASPKSLSSDSLKPLSDGSLSVPSAPEISLSSKSNSIPSVFPNHVAPARQKSMKRGVGGGGASSSAADGEVALPSPPPSLSSLPTTISEKQAPRELSPMDQTTNNTTNRDHGSSAGGLASQAHDGGDHVRSHGGSRRWNNGGVAGSHRNNYSNLRDVERGGYDGYRRNSGGRDIRMQPRGARPYMRPPGPPVTPPFVSPPPQVGPFGNPVVFPADMPSSIFYVATQPPPGGVPFVPHPAVPPPMFYPAIDPNRASLLQQIDYYFSPENLCRDVYLRQRMNKQGWVPISLIAGFNRVEKLLDSMNLTNSIEFIMDTLRLSMVVEVQGERVRKRNDWMNWLLPSSNNQFANAAGQSLATPNPDNLATNLQSLGLEGTGYHSSTRLPNSNFSRSASGNLSNQLQVAVNQHWDESGQVAALRDLDLIRSGRSLVRSDTL
ncbi:la-related protein 1B isoform X1 [Canna indica]|uniref:La-related protein 1B isoform X1 n=1 Tax=Canna indica TaxID=4628 RepID=A0AAQ3KJD9_9LILI|nr:la-related protein 1B isoform X1 [Canna indica]